MSIYDVTESSKAQQKYCELNSVPNFAPTDGKCWSCHENIYMQLNESRGISVKEASQDHITGCPHCHRTFLD